MADPLMEYNPLTGRHRVVLRNGDPVLDESPDYQISSLLCEDPWLAEETPRIGNLAAEFSESTSVTENALKLAAERRVRPLIEQGVLSEFTVTGVTQPAPGVLRFAAMYTRPGEPEPQTFTLELGT